MQKFAEVLSEYLSEKRISFKKAASEIPMDRTQLKRYATGERLPKDKASVIAIAKGIGMSEEQQMTLISSYERSRMGEKKFRAFNLIEQILEGRSTGVPKKTCNLSEVNKMCYQKDNTIINIYNRIELYKWVNYVCDGAENLKIVIKTGEQYDGLHDIIHSGINNSHDMENSCIEQIVYLNNDFNSDDVQDIETFDKVYRVMECGVNCKIYSIYDNCDKLVTHNYLISNKGIVVFYAFEKEPESIIGIYTNKADIQSYYEKMFTDLKENSYLYGYTDEGTVTETTGGRIFENLMGHIRIGFFNKNRQSGIWICKQNRGFENKYIYIMEDTIVTLFNSYMDTVQG